MNNTNLEINYILDQIKKALDEIKESGVSNQNINNAIDILFALKFKLEKETM